MFAGRESELQELTAFAREALAGKAGVLFISGEAGMGKTTLAQELLRRLSAEYPTLVTLSKKCTLEGASYLPFRGMLEELVERRGEVNISGEIGRKRDKVKDTVIDVIKNVGTDVLSVFLPQTVAGITEKGVLSVFGQLFSKRQKDLGGLVAPKDLEQIQVFGWYTRVMKNIADKFPLALLIDDLHWADASSLNLLLHLGRELEGSRLLVIGTYRSHDVAPNALLTQVTTKLGRYGAKLFSLDVAQEQPSAQQRAAQFVRDYLASRYQTNFSDRFERLLIDRTEGNALFLTELLKNMEEKGEIVQDAGAWRMTAQISGLADLPERVEQTIKERVDRVTMFSKTLAETLECASVEGDDFIAQVVAKVKERDDMQVLDELTDQLMSAYQLIYERGGASLANGSRIHEFAFKHNLIREYVYQHLPKTKRELLHVKIGGCLETLYAPNADDIAAQLAVHFYHGHVLEKAVVYGLKAAQDANARYGAAEAVRFAKMGLEALETRKAALPPNEYAETKVRLLLELAKAEGKGGDQQGEKNHLQAGISYLEDNFSLTDYISKELLVEVYAQLGRLYSKMGGGNELKQKENMEQALALYEQLGERNKIPAILRLLADTTLYLNIWVDGKSPKERGIELLERSLSIAEQVGDIELQISCLDRLMSLTKDFEYIEQGALRSINLLKRIDQSNKRAQVPAILATVKVHNGYAKYKIAIKEYQKALDIAINIGDIDLERFLLYELGLTTAYYLSLQSEAQHLLRRSISIIERLGSDRWAFRVFGNILIKLGHWKEAEQCFQTMMAQTSERGVAYCTFSMGFLSMLLGNYTQAEKDFLYYIEVCEKYGATLYLINYPKIGQNYALLGNVAQCQKYIELIQSAIQKHIAPSLKMEGLCETAEVYRLLREFEAAKTSCQQSLDWFLASAEDPEDLVVVAEARLIMGKILVDMEEHQEAIVYLEKAQAAFEICQHYALGDTLLYLGKAHLGLGGVILRRQGKEYVAQALAEFERLELAHKAQEARELLKALP